MTSQILLRWRRQFVPYAVDTGGSTKSKVQTHAQLLMRPKMWSVLEEERQAVPQRRWEER